ncbi:MAG: hypothetical protein A3B70_02050 [Deltaproteobacteria bacterium RIFCSPHIGHO2_02_FULL_40_11]|nr:MAG: hypothetical protein A3B70_02050 [Deltaproteobacteria bacterium RIFCSPHIGHO2_02_FULL_40_11]
MKKLILTLCLGISLSAFAQHDRVGNGGHGTFVGQQLYLLDFVEHGLEETADFGEEDPQQENYKKELKETIDLLKKSLNLPNFPYELMAMKYHQLVWYDENANLSVGHIELMLENLTWRVINQDIEESTDDKDSILKEGDNVTIALRQGKLIRITKKYWDMLDDKNKVGLIFHEILYAALELVHPHYFGTTYMPRVEIIKALMGYIFSKDFRQFDMHRIVGQSYEALFWWPKPWDIRTKIDRATTYIALWSIDLDTYQITKESKRKVADDIINRVDFIQHLNAFTMPLERATMRHFLNKARQKGVEDLTKNQRKALQILEDRLADWYARPRDYFFDEDHAKANGNAEDCWIHKKGWAEEF